MKVNTGLISACLIGINSNWKGGSASKRFIDFFRSFISNNNKDIHLIPICPEQLGGLPTPRKPAEILGSSLNVLFGKSEVVNLEGKIVTKYFINGALETLKIAQLCGATFAILKENSPSCGVHYVRTGLFNGSLRSDMGITSRMLFNHGIKLYSEKDFMYICGLNLLCFPPEEWWLYTIE